MYALEWENHERGLVLDGGIEREVNTDNVKETTSETAEPLIEGARGAGTSPDAVQRCRGTSAKRQPSFTSQR